MAMWPGIMKKAGTGPVPKASPTEKAKRKNKGLKGTVPASTHRIKSFT
jgi:hypothetical protein